MLILASRFLLQNVEKRSCRYSLAHGNTRTLERAEIVAAKKVFTKVKNFLGQTNVIDWCTRDRTNSK